MTPYARFVKDLPIEITTEDEETIRVDARQRLETANCVWDAAFVFSDIGNNFSRVMD